MKKEYRLNQIKKVEVFAKYVYFESVGYSYYLSLVLGNGEIVPLNPNGSDITFKFGKQIIPEETLGTKIADFLGVPFEETQSHMVKLLKEREKHKK